MVLHMACVIKSRCAQEYRVIGCWQRVARGIVQSYIFGPSTYLAEWVWVWGLFLITLPCTVKAKVLLFSKRLFMWYKFQAVCLFFSCHSCRICGRSKHESVDSHFLVYNSGLVVWGWERTKKGSICIISPSTDTDSSINADTAGLCLPVTHEGVRPSFNEGKAKFSYLILTYQQERRLWFPCESDSLSLQSISREQNSCVYQIATQDSTTLGMGCFRLMCTWLRTFHIYFFEDKLWSRVWLCLLSELLLTDTFCEVTK